MTSGVPWPLQGMRPEARESAREAARRAGMSLEDWLAQAIIDRALGEGVSAKHLAAEHKRPAIQHDLSDVKERLDQLTRQLEKVTESGAAPNARIRESGSDNAPERLTDAIDRLDQRLKQIIAEGRHAEVRPASIQAGTPASPKHPQSGPIVPSGYGPPRSHEPARTVQPNHGWSSSIEHAVAEIEARQRALEADPATASGYGHRSTFGVSVPPRHPTPDLTGLEQQLRNITDQIQALRPCALHDTVAALRNDLAEIARSLTEALPRRAVEALENEVRALGTRIDRGRVAGGDPAAIAGVERGLAEVRDALRALTPAEGLVGIDEAVRALSRKIDQLSQSQQDPRAVQQLEEAIAALRGVVSHVASNDSLGKLAEEVRNMAALMERALGGSETFSRLETQIAALAEGGRKIPDELESLIRTLADRLEQLQLTRGDHLALGSLEDRIVKLVEKLDASDARFGHLDTIERGLTDLLVHLDEIRNGSGGPRAPRDPALVDAALGVDTLKRDIAEIKQTQSASDRRTQDSLEAVHATLGLLVDRLATIESEMRSRRSLEGESAPPADVPRPSVAPRPLAGQPQAAPAAQPAASSAPAPAPRPAPNVAAPASQARKPIDPNLPPDHPLEPGTGAPRSRPAGSPADRIAASEAALAGTRPPGVVESGKQNFLAAARRAAQAASEHSAIVAGSNSGGPASADSAALGSRIAKHVRQLLVATTVVVAALGTLRVAYNVWDEADPKLPDLPQVHALGPTNTPSNVQSDRRAAPDVGDAGVPPAGVIGGERRNTGLLSGQTDVTGSVERAVPPSPAAAPTTRTQPPVNAAPADKLPASLSPGLRLAAVNGEPTAEYEIALRYAEGRGIPANLEEAARWFERAAKAGLAPAQFRLASLYEKGQGVKKDLDAARRLYTAAAQKGNAKAMHNLAVLYAEGVEGKPDYKVAAQWFRSAAQHGIADSQYNLAILYARGIGVAQNLSESYKWFVLASAGGDQDAAKKRDDVGSRLDQQSLVAARLAAQTFTPDPQPDEAVNVNVPPGGWDRAGAAAAPSKPKPRA